MFHHAESPDNLHREFDQANQENKAEKIENMTFQFFPHVLHTGYQLHQSEKVPEA